MKILMVMPFYYPATRFGGPVFQSFEVAKRLAGLGHSVSVITSDIDIGRSEKRDQWVSKDAIQIYYGSTSWFSRYPPYVMPRVRKVIEECVSRIDVVYVRVGLTMLNSSTMKIAKKHSVPMVYNAEGCLCPTRLKIKRWSKFFFLRLFERRLLAASTRLHACSLKEADDYILQGADRGKIDIIPNGVALPSANGRLRELSESFRKQFGIPVGPVVLYMGRLVHLKRPDLLLDAFSRLPKALNAQLVFAGADWGMESLLRTQATSKNVANRTFFVGELEGDLKLGALTTASVFGLISESEGLPNAVLEALAHGIPCIVSRYCNTDQVASSNAGYITELDPAEVADRLSTLLSDVQQRLAQSAAARRLASDCFAMDTVVRSIEESLSRAIHETKLGA